ncbi:MAG: ferrous iron transport protein B [Pseudomonadota bacterium]|nr:ferrous iron transport protein B [Pseudomonadota bacterium]
MNDTGLQPSLPKRGADAPQRVISSRHPLVALIGNPNTGKSTLFNALTGLRQKIANYPGVTVEWHQGTAIIDERPVRILDLPGTYTLTANSPDEAVAVDALLGRITDLGRPDAVVVVVDGSNLKRNLFLVTQLLEIELPVVVALNMSDRLGAAGIELDPEALSDALGAPVVPIAAARNQGLDPLKSAIGSAVDADPPTPPPIIPEIRDSARSLVKELDWREPGAVFLVTRAIVDVGGDAERRLLDRFGQPAQAGLARARQALESTEPPAAVEARQRYQWIGEQISHCQNVRPMPPTWSERLDRVIGHPLAGTLLFVGVMAMVFQAVFAWAGPLMDWIDGLSGMAASAVTGALPEGAIASLIADGVIAGVGSVVIFLPQILILFLFIILLEDSGYMARAAFMMDRLMRWCGLSGQSFIPMLSSFACAVPGIMGTRVIPNHRDRIATILAAPFMTCSARLPVYALLIAAFIPRTQVLGVLNLQGLVLLGLYLLGIAGGITTAMLLKRTALRGPTPTFVMEMPPYRLPNMRSVLLRLWERARLFLVRAGTVIFAVAVVIWSLTYFPRSDDLAAQFEAEQAQLAAGGDAQEAERRELENRYSAAHLEQSWLGRFGKTVEPLFAPLGWDWRVSAAVIASFPAREVVIAALGTIYAVGADTSEDDPGLITRLRNSRHDDGSRVFTLPMALGLMVFYAFCLQCAATVATIWRETNSWRWPLFAWSYMTTLGYLGAMLCFQVGSG